MSNPREFFNRLQSFFHKQQRDAELDAELKSHLEMAVEENLRRGLPPDEARRQALVRFGGVEQAREQQREARGLFTLDIFLQDLRYTFRTLGRDRGFTTIAILILALAIGANIAVFSVVNTLLLRPLPFADAERLAWIAPPPAKCGLSCATYSTDAYDEFRAYTRSYDDVTGYFAFSDPGNLSLNLGEAPISATSIDVIANFFQVLGVQPAMGRLFTADDARNGAPPVILLTNAWWRSQFAADPNIVGKTFVINGRQTTVHRSPAQNLRLRRGVFTGRQSRRHHAAQPLWTAPLLGQHHHPDRPPQTRRHHRPGPRRCRPGSSPHVREQQVSRLVRHLQESVIPVPLKDYVSGRLRSSLILLWSAVGVILLIACVNLSNLLLARAAARSKEFAMRSALGASRARIVRQLITESLILSGAGALVGLALALLLVQWLAHQGSVALPLLSTLQVDGAALLWTLLIAAASAMFFGLVPGLRMASGNLLESLKTPAPAPAKAASKSAFALSSSPLRSPSPACCSSALASCCGVFSTSSVSTWASSPIAPTQSKWPTTIPQRPQAIPHRHRGWESCSGAPRFTSRSSRASAPFQVLKPPASPITCPSPAIAPGGLRGQKESSRQTTCPPARWST